MAETVIQGIVPGNVVVVPSVSEMIAKMQRFHWMDYVTLGTMLVCCLLIGVYYAFYKVSNTTQEYLMGGKKMKLIPISASLIASYLSAISMLGIPTETYLYGGQYFNMILGLFLTTVVMVTIFIPVVYNLNLTSIYEYLERRFDRRVRVLGCFLFTIYIITWLSIVIYVPALAFNQVTGVNVHFLTPIICLICIFYTSLGGLQAVVAIDFFQSIFMLGSIILVAIKGTLDIGGIKTVWERNLATGRLEIPSFDLSPFTRYTVWAAMFGASFEYLHSSALNQLMTQRFCALPSLKTAKKAAWLYFLGLSTLISVSAYLGLLIFATFHECDPLATKLAKEKDQLLPLLVMKVLGNYPGLAGLFVAGILSASLSSLSTGLNSMSALVVEDFYQFLFNKEMTEKQAYFAMRVSVVIFGSIFVGLVYVVENLGSVMQLTIIAGSISTGAALGLFVMGIVFPWINAKGALAGGLSSLAFMAWLCIRAQSAIALGELVIPAKPLSTSGCKYHFIPKEMGNLTAINEHVQQYSLHHMSYLWYPMLGVLVAVVIGLIVSFATKAQDPRDVELSLLAPFYRKIIKPRDFPNEPIEGIIYAFQPTTTKNN